MHTETHASVLGAVNNRPILLTQDSQLPLSIITLHTLLSMVQSEWKILLHCPPPVLGIGGLSATLNSPSHPHPHLQILFLHNLHQNYLPRLCLQSSKLGWPVCYKLGTHWSDASFGTPVTNIIRRPSIRIAPLVAISSPISATTFVAWGKILCLSFLSLSPETYCTPLFFSMDGVEDS